MGFSRKEYWSELPFPSLGDLPDPESKPMSPALQADSLPLSHPINVQYSFYSRVATLCCDAQASRCSGLSCQGAQALDTRALVFAPRGLICPTACGVFLEQGSNLCPLH